MISFRIYPEKSLYYKVSVFKNRKEMYSYFKEYNESGAMKKIGYTFAAICYSYDRINIPKGKPQRKEPILGEILFTSEKMSAMIVSHECSHAANYYLFGRLELNPAEIYGSLDERFATVQGNLVGQIYKHYWKHFNNEGKLIN